MSRSSKSASRRGSSHSRRSSTSSSSGLGSYEKTEEEKAAEKEKERLWRKAYLEKLEKERKELEEEKHKQMAVLRDCGWFLFGLNGNDIKRNVKEYYLELLEKMRGNLKPANKMILNQLQRLENLRIEDVGSVSFEDFLPNHHGDSNSYNRVASYVPEPGWPESTMPFEIRTLFRAQIDLTRDEIELLVSKQTEEELMKTWSDNRKTRASKANGGTRKRKNKKTKK
jgi:hypothetical protein